MLTSWPRAASAAGNAASTSPRPPVRASGASSLPATRILIGWRIGAESLTSGNRESGGKRLLKASAAGPSPTRDELRPTWAGSGSTPQNGRPQSPQNEPRALLKNPLV